MRRHERSNPIKAGVLPAEQVVRGTLYQIRAVDLQSERVFRAMGRKGGPCHLKKSNSNRLQILEGGAYNDPFVALGRSNALLDAAIVEEAGE